MAPDEVEAEAPAEVEAADVDEITDELAHDEAVVFVSILRLELVTVTVKSVLI